MKKLITNSALFLCFLLLYIVGFFVVNLIMGLLGFTLFSLALPSLPEECAAGYAWSSSRVLCVPFLEAIPEIIFDILLLLSPFIFALLAPMAAYGTLMKIFKRNKR